MTIQGAINELVNLLKADDIPIYYKGGIKKVIETIDDYIDGKDDYVKRIRTKEHIVAESIANMGRDESQTSGTPYKIDTSSVCNYEPQTERSE